jgi:FAD/FMN-containing dehydrogenase
MPEAPVADAAVQALRSQLSGDVIVPGDASYDEARALFNGMIDRRPALIARVRSAADAAAAIRFAAAEGLPLAVRGGGHSVAGFSMIDGALVVDCALMDQVRVDPDAATIVAGAGCRWRHVDLAAGEHGLATPGGTISDTGIAGFTLGGGFGFLSKRYGLACDNLLQAEMVLANGDIVRVNETSERDLFWAIRGGGGNFGVVTEFTFRAHPVRDVTFGVFLWPGSRAEEEMEHYRDAMPDTPPEAVALAAYVSAPPLPFVPPEAVGTDALLIGVVHLGTPEEAEPVTGLFASRSPMASAVMPLPYPVLQQALDATAPAGTRNYWRSAYMPTPPDEAVRIMAAAGATKGSPMSMIQLINGGPLPEADNAFPNREYPFLYHLLSLWTDPSEDERHIGWNRALARDLAPYASEGGYLNFIGDEGADRVRRTYGAKYERLVAIKRRYDPDNVFRHNQNIAP